MKMRITYALVCLVMLFACNQPQDQTTSPLLSEYQVFLSKLDSTDITTAVTAAKQYQLLFKGADTATKDKGFILFNKYYGVLENTANAQHDKDTTNYEALFMLDSTGEAMPAPKKLKDYNEGLKRNGLQLAASEGTTYIQQDKDFIAKWFYHYVSPVMKTYLEQLNRENKEGFQEDAGLTITEKQYVQRLVWWDNFIQKNPVFVLIDDARANRKYLLTFFLEGMDNSPVLAFSDSKEVEEYYKTAYSYLGDKFPHSETNQIVEPYFKALLQKDSAKAANLLKDYKKKGIIIDFKYD